MTPPKKQIRTAPRFIVLATRWVDQVVRAADTPRAVRIAFADKYQELERRGCKAANYRLSGPGDWPRFCVADLGCGFKLVMAFRDATTIILLELDAHTNRKNPYAWLAAAFELPDSAGHGGGRAQRVPCCEDAHNPPVADELSQALDDLLKLRQRIGVPMPRSSEPNN